MLLLSLVLCLCTSAVVSTPAPLVRVAAVPPSPSPGSVKLQTFGSIGDQSSQHQPFIYPLGSIQRYIQHRTSAYFGSRFTPTNAQFKSGICPMMSLLTSVYSFSFTPRPEPIAHLSAFVIQRAQMQGILESARLVEPQVEFAPASPRVALKYLNSSIDHSLDAVQYIENAKLERSQHGRANAGDSCCGREFQLQHQAPNPFLSGSVPAILHSPPGLCSVPHPAPIEAWLPHSARSDCHLRELIITHWGIPASALYFFTRLQRRILTCASQYCPVELEGPGPPFRTQFLPTAHTGYEPDGSLEGSNAGRLCETGCMQQPHPPPSRRTEGFANTHGRFRVVRPSGDARRPSGAGPGLGTRHQPATQAARAFAGVPAPAACGARAKQFGLSRGMEWDGRRRGILGRSIERADYGELRTLKRGLPEHVDAPLVNLSTTWDDEWGKMRTSAARYSYSLFTGARAPRPPARALDTYLENDSECRKVRGSGREIRDHAHHINHVMLLLASVLPPLPSLFLRASSAASCPIGHATDSVVLAHACGALAVLKHTLYELVCRPSAWASPRTTSAAREDLMAVWILTMLPYSPDLALCAGKAQYKLARESGVADDYLYDSRRSPKRTRRRRGSARPASCCTARCGIIWTFGSGLPRFGLESNISVVFGLVLKSGLK
ncbi:hypothetical protein FB451DRAFT_1186844 [Mycena latifolia]|nr:hypothetical protein FB451DRAFT_1186844 [Mycena latifolia]